MIDPRIRKAIADFYGNQPHPKSPNGLVAVKDWEVYHKTAQMMHGKSDPDGSLVEHTYQTLENLKLSPSEFAHYWEKARPVANRFLNGRDPTMNEIANFARANLTPGQIYDYYHEHPHPDYPEVKAGPFTAAWKQAEPIARRYGATPNGYEVSRFAMAKYTSEDMVAHYSERK